MKPDSFGSYFQAAFPIYLGDEAVARLIDYCRAQGHDRFLQVADENTYAALGRRVASGLSDQGWDVRTVILRGDAIEADERRVLEVLLHAEGQPLLYVAVGSGTITDITRYASFCARNPFISLPTAPSVDAYASSGAALIMGGYKLTILGQAPAAIFADLPTLQAAPPEMIAAGFADMLGKFTSLADWRLGALLLEERYDDAIATRTRQALERCADQVAEVGRASAQGIATLTEGLLESGLCMMAFGSSRPASGAEHLMSHFWEIAKLPAGQLPLWHGTKVGLGTVLAARRYAALRALTRQEALEWLAAAPDLSVADEVARIQAIFGPLAERIVANQRPFLELLAKQRETLRLKIGDRWTDIQEIAASVPPPEAIAGLLRQAGGASDPRQVGLSQAQVDQALAQAHYMRGRFTVVTLGRLLCLW